MKIQPLSIHGQNPYQSIMSIKNKQSHVNETSLNQSPSTSNINQVKQQKEISPAHTLSKFNQSKEQLEMSSREMKIKSEAVQQKLVQDEVTKAQMKHSSLSKLHDKTNSLKELSIQHQNSSKDDQPSIEKQATEILSTLKEDLSKSSEKMEQSLLKMIENVEPKEILNSEFIQKLSEPVEQAKSDVKGHVENLASSITELQMLSKEQVQSTFEQIKNSLKNTNVKSLFDSLDARRSNVSYLLQ